MTREWKPGDVAVATVAGRPDVRVVAGWSKYDPQLRWCELSPRWADGDDDECWFMPHAVTNARPLVVIDAEDREQVERLARAFATEQSERGHWNVWWTDLQAALRSLIEPPKPDEPTGLGAVVEDADGRTYVRTADADCRLPWSYANNFSDHDWADVRAVRVLSEGVVA